VGVAIVVATAALLWFVRPNRDSGSTSPIETITTPTTVAGDSSTTVPPSTTPTTTAPTEPSTP
jgi:hypothetical protein